MDVTQPIVVSFRDRQRIPTAKRNLTGVQAQAHQGRLSPVHQRGDLIRVLDIDPSLRVEAGHEPVLLQAEASEALQPFQVAGPLVRGEPVCPRQLRAAGDPLADRVARIG